MSAPMLHCFVTSLFTGIIFGNLTLASTQVSLPIPEIESLPNGLKLVWFQNDHLPMIDLSVIVQAGYRDDPNTKSGTAELVSTLLDRGSSGMSAQQMAHSIEMLGASRFAIVDDDSLSVGLHGLAPDAPLLLELLGKIMIQPSFPEGEVKRETDRLIDRYSHIEDYNEALVSLAYHRIVTAHTSYGRGGLLSLKELSTVKRKDIVEYYKKYFTPKNSILMIVGRVDQLQFRNKIQSIFGAWQGQGEDDPKHEWKNYSDKRLSVNKRTVVVVDRPELTQAQVRIGFKAPLVNVPEHYSLTVANALLGEYYNSRLNTLIRDKLGLTYSISSGFSYSKDFAEFTIASATRNETVGLLINKTLGVLKGLIKGPLSNDEVQLAKAYLLGRFPIATSTLSDVASRWLVGYTFGMGTDYLNQFSPQINEVTVASVQSAVSKYFDLDQIVIVVAGKSMEIQKSLMAAHLKPIKKVRASDLK